MAVRDGEQDRLGQQRAEKLDLLLVTGWAEPAAFTGEGQQVLVLTVVAPDTGEPAFEIATVQELVHHLGNDRAQETVVRLVVTLPRMRRLEDISCVESSLQPFPPRYTYAINEMDWPRPPIREVGAVRHKVGN